MIYDLNNASFGLFAGALPVLDRGFLPVDSRHPSDPKDTRSFVMLGRNVVKDHSSFARRLVGIKGIFHRQENVHILRLALRRHKGSKNDEPCQLSRTTYKGIATSQPLRHEAPLKCTGPKLCDHFG